MTNKLIFPFLIILFSIIIIYGIFNIKYNNTFLTNIEKFQNNYLESNTNNIKKNLLNGNQTTIDIANGNWSWFNSTVNSSNYIVSNMLTIDANSDMNSSNLGTLTFPYTLGTKTNNLTFNIVSILNGNLIAVMNVISIQMSFTNIFTDETNINPSYTNIQNIPNAVVSIYLQDILLTKFSSYKIYNNTVGGEVYRIISSSDIYINSPPPVFDFATYNVLINSYQYPSSYASLIMGGTDNTIIQTIQNNYLGNLQFSIQRIFMSPAQAQSNGSPTQIITSMSKPITLKVSPGQVPSQLVICSFEEDKIANNLTNFFEPIGTIVYFYQYVSSVPSYYFADNNLISNNAATVLQYQNNANNMFEQDISYNMLNTVTKQNTFNFKLIQLPGIFPSTNINSTTTIIFTSIPL